MKNRPDMKTHMYCPTCGKPTTFKSRPEWLLGHFRGIYASTIAALIQARKIRRGLNWEELARAAYADRDGEMPVEAWGTVRTLINRNMGKLNDLGWDIVGPNVTRNGYWLVPLENIEHE